MELIFTLVTGMLIFTDYKLYKTFFTPFSLIASVHVCLILINNFIAIKMGFFKISSQSIGYILYFMILIFLIGLLYYFSIKKRSRMAKCSINAYINNVIYRNKRFIITLFFIGLVSKYISLLQVATHYGLANIKGKAFGIFAHVGSLSEILMPFMVILFLQDKKKVNYLIGVILLFINVFIFGGKYGAAITFLHLIALYAIIKNVNVNITKLLKISIIAVLFAVLMFIVVYAIRPVIVLGYFDKDMFVNSLYFSLRHFMFYLVGPIIATNYYFSNPAGLSEGFKIMFAVPINIIKAIFRTGNYVNPIYPYFIPVSATYATNVGGLFAEAVYCSGFFVASVYVSIFFLIVYNCYIKSRYQGKMLSLTSLLLAVSMMMFFGNFLTVSGVVIQIIFLWILEVFMKKKIVFKR